jgi:GT2 family glycosyltransferase
MDFEATAPSDKLPFLAVVIPMLNAVDTLAEQLDAVAAQRYDGRWEVLIADNGSRDGSLELARSYSDRLPELRIVDASQGRGANHARNRAAQEARGEFLVLCDADDVVEPGWLAAMAEAAPHADLLGGSFDEETLNSPDLRRWRPSRAADALPVSHGFMAFAVGSNCALRRSVWQELGGWDESYHLGGDDVELAWRLQLAGYRLEYVPKARVQTRYRESLRSLASQFYRRGCAVPRLYREFRSAGLARRPLRVVLDQWFWVVSRAPALLRSRGWRGLWLRKAAYNFGYVRGSIEQRVLFL